jgi:hypothetical protein
MQTSLFQIVAGLRYAFPKAMLRQEKKAPRVVSLHDRVALRPRTLHFRIWFSISLSS